MSSPVAVDIFVEDRAHEEFLVPLLRRVAMEEEIVVSPRVRSARGGHGRAIAELELYQRLAAKGSGAISCPDLLIVGIDGNCTTFTRKKKEIQNATDASFQDRLIVACPDPHVERWFLADPESFCEIVGRKPRVGRKKCQRDYYKDVLARTVREAGHPATLGGIEFAPELVEAMDLYRAGKDDRSLKSFVEDLRVRLRGLRSETEG
jgi:hypothetical protein